MQIGPITADFAPFLAADSLRLYRRAGTGNCLVRSLLGVGKDFSAWPPLEFVNYANASRQHHFPFVADNRRSWRNDDDLAKTIAGKKRHHLDHEIANGAAQAPATGENQP